MTVRNYVLRRSFYLVFRRGACFEEYDGSRFFYIFSGRPQAASRPAACPKKALSEILLVFPRRRLHMNGAQMRYFQHLKNWGLGGLIFRVLRWYLDGTSTGDY
jgi:hypothetical protein